MSIEKDLQNLTQAVVKLTELLDLVILNAEQRAQRDAAVEPAPTPEPTPEPTPTPTAEPNPTPEPAPAPSEPSGPTTTKELMDWALEQTRSDPEFKNAMKSVLADHGVKTLSKLPEKDIPAVYAALGGGH